jgi:hypothetical protein
MAQVSFKEEMFRNMYDDFKRSSYFVQSLVGLSFEKSMKTFLVLVYGINENIEEIIGCIKPIYAQDILNMQSVCCSEESKLTCQHFKCGCSFCECKYMMKEIVFCPVRSRQC